MIIPYGTDRPLKRPTSATYWIIGLNLIIFIIGAVFERTNPDGFAVQQARLWLDPNQFRPLNLITYQFLHGGVMHIASNLLFLYVFGPNVEDKLGRAAFLAFYLAGGAAAGGAHCLLERPIVEGGMAFYPPVIGASGAIAAVTGAYMVLFPRTLVRVFSLFIFIGSFEIPALWLILLAISKDLFFHGLGASQGVALVAHLGGYAFGIAVSIIILWARPVAREPYDLFSISKQAHRRRTFRELASRGNAPWIADAKRRVTKPAARGHKSAPDPVDPQFELRAIISRHVSEGDTAAAAREYVRLVERAGEAILPRDAQLIVANQLFASGDHSTAATAYELFIRKYGSDREAPRTKLMLALVSARYLNDPVRAKALLVELASAPLTEEEASLRGTLAREIG